MSRDQRRGNAWYLQPIVWLGMLVFVVALAGSIWLIVVAGGHEDDAIPVGNQRIFGVPTQQGAPP